jgi:hypothetical protein
MHSDNHSYDREYDETSAEEYCDEDTLFKVTAALVKSGMTFTRARECIALMESSGILFRERL